ncbi:MAG: hypothetical protein ACM3UU_01190 [Ignavibacteriales bacterium]
MGFLNNLLSKFQKPSASKEIEALSNSCNTLFQRIFNKCRRELGQELIEVINIKKNALESFKSSGSDADLKALLVKKILILTETYLKLAENHANCMEGLNNSSSESTSSELIKANREKLTQIVSLLKSLNVQLNLNSDSSFVEDSEDVINEAMALNNVLDDTFKNKL